MRLDELMNEQNSDPEVISFQIDEAWWFSPTDDSALMKMARLARQPKSITDQWLESGKWLELSQLSDAQRSGDEASGESPCEK